MPCPTKVTSARSPRGKRAISSAKLSRSWSTRMERKSCSIRMKVLAPPPRWKSWGKLVPAFQKTGLMTAGTSSQISDGAAAILVGNKAKAESLGVATRARFRSMAVVGVDPTIMLTGVIPATEVALKKGE